RGDNHGLAVLPGVAGGRSSRLGGRANACRSRGGAVAICLGERGAQRRRGRTCTLRRSDDFFGSRREGVFDGLGGIGRKLRNGVDLLRQRSLGEDLLGLGRTQRR